MCIIRIEGTLISGRREGGKQPGQAPLPPGGEADGFFGGADQGLGLVLAFLEFGLGVAVGDHAAAAATRSRQIPALSGSQGPGDKMMPRGSMASTSAADNASFRRTSTPAPSSPR